MKKSIPLALILLSIVSTALKAETWTPARMWVVGGDQTLWIVGASGFRGDAQSEVRMWVSQGTGNASVAIPAASRFLPPILGDPIFVAADKEALHILFGDLTAYDYFASRHGSPGAIWKSICTGKPLTWGGDATESVLWAVVLSDEVVVAVPTSAAATQKASNESSAQRPAFLAESRHALVQLKNGKWTASAFLPAADDAIEFWISGRDGNPHLFWRTPKNRIRFARRIGDNWSSPQTVIEEDAGKYGWPAASETGAVFIAGFEDSPNKVRLRMNFEKDGRWIVEGWARDGNEPLTIDDAHRCGVGIARGRLCIARATQDGGIEAGLGDLTSSPSVRFWKLSPGNTVSPTILRWGGETMNLILTLAIATGVLFSRRLSLPQPAVVPKGWMIAPVWKRFLAGIVDLIPAILLTMPWAYQALMDLGFTDDPARLRESAEDPEVLARILPVYYVLSALFGAWCFLWELSSGTTLGKRILGCKVASADGMALTPRQVFSRNTMRAAMFALGSIGILTTIMVMLLVSRKRQHLGDILGGTIVIQEGYPVARPQSDPFE